jgi:hypothetical protein
MGDLSGNMGSQGPFLGRNARKMSEIGVLLAEIAMFVKY